MSTTPLYDQNRSRNNEGINRKEKAKLFFINATLADRLGSVKSNYQYCLDGRVDWVSHQSPAPT